MFIAAAGTDFQSYAVEKQEFIAIAIDPTDFDNTVGESTNSNLIEIIPHWKIRDPLIFGIAWALKTELESGGINGTRIGSITRGSRGKKVSRVHKVS